MKFAVNLVKFASYLVRGYVAFWVFMNASMLAKAAGLQMASNGQKILIPVGMTLVTVFVLCLPELILAVRELRRMPVVARSEEMERQYQQDAEVKKPSIPIHGTHEYELMYGQDLTRKP